jgi:hypothetical protein
MECAFNNVYTPNFGIEGQCTQNCVENSDGGDGGGGVNMITIIIIAVTISLALGFCGYAYCRKKRGKAEAGDKPLPSLSQDADKGKVHHFDQSDKTARTEISGKVRTEANSTASVKHGILETNLLQLLAPKCSPLRVARKRHGTWRAVERRY